MRGDGAEVRAVLPPPRPILHQPQVGLVDQGRRLQRLTGTLATQIRGSEPPQLLVHDRQQRIELGTPLLTVRHYSTRSILTLFITIGETGRSCRPVGTPPIFRTTSSPSTTAPKTE